MNHKQTEDRRRGRRRASRTAPEGGLWAESVDVGGARVSGGVSDVGGFSDVWVAPGAGSGVGGDGLFRLESPLL